MARLLETTSTKYLKRLLKILRYKPDIYTDGRRLYSFDGFQVSNGKLFYSEFAVQVDPDRLFDGNGQQIIASRKP